MFNIRVYGFCVNEKGKILVTDEWIQNKKITKIPGGGLQFGEGTLDCLKREFKEELRSEIYIIKHIYTTDFFQPSIFSNNEQVISIYYQVQLKTSFKMGILESDIKTSDSVLYEKKIIFRYTTLSPQLVHILDLPIDKRAFEVFWTGFV